MNAKHAYYGMISYIDEKIGNLLTALERANLSENTIIIFTADHGEMMGERGMWYKQHFFEWASRIPLIIHAPDKFKAGRIPQNCSLVDIMPTLLELANEAPFDELVDTSDGQSLVPALFGKPEELSDIAYSEFAADGSTGPSRMVKHKNYKYMDLEGVDELLFDVVKDPDEQDNLIGNPLFSDLADQMRKLCKLNWDMEDMRGKIANDQKRRLKVHHSTKGDPTYVNIVRSDDAERYIRNAGAADTKAKARLPYVAPARPK